MPASRRKQVIAAVIGNALEWYDFVVFGFLTVIISRLFFPEDSELLALLKTTATFGVGFFMRPVGGIVLGLYADRHGRKAALQLIMGLMTIALLLIATAPPYAAIGVGAPLIIVLARLLQGFATGGEFAIATSFLVEIAPREQRGLYGSLQQVGLALAALGGAVAGMAVTIGLNPEQLDSWGWRLPFVVGLLIAPVGIYIRRHVEEPAEFVASQQRAPARLSIMRMLASNLRGVLVTFGLIICGTITYYVLLVYMPTFAQKQLGLTLAEAFKVQVIALLCLTAIVPLFGALSDRIGRRPILICGCLMLLLALYPLFARTHAAPDFCNLLIMQIALCSLLGVFYGPLATAVAEQFEPGVRSTGLSLAYNLAVMLFGGFAQFFVTFMIDFTGDPLAAAYYVMFGCTVGLIAACFVRQAPLT
jgi:MFS transporter, MHS family, proline/betaine transporter